MSFASLEQMVATSFEAMRPPERLTVTEAAEKYHIIRQPGSHNGPWSRSKTPYIVEPQNILTSLDYTGMVFVGPARTGKSIMLSNWVFRTAKCDPVDMMVVHMSRDTAREWAKSDLEKSFRYSPEIGKLLSPARTDDNLFDKQFLSGMRLTITWPTIKNLSGKTVRFQFIPDYDRHEENVDGEGDVFTQVAKRGGTFGRFRMTAAESSPGKEVTDPRWLPRTPHEAPPTTGILGLYNLGDRRRWYWECPDCHEAFEPDFSLLQFDAEADDLMAAADATFMACPHCGGVMLPDQKDELNSGGRWVRDGMIWHPSSGEIVAREGMTPARSNIASFWMKGPAAGFHSWQGLVLDYLQAERLYRETGDETKLRSVTTTGMGVPYISRARLSARLPEELRAAAEEWGSTQEEPTVPLGVRFLVATVDVQVRSFVVQIHGFTADGDVYIVDCFKIRLADRLDAEERNLPLEPATFKEDWNLLVDQVMLRSYALADGSGRRMGILLTGCDSGGRDGATANAYQFWRSLRAGPDGLHRRFALVKGHATPKAPRAYVSWPDSNKTGRLAVAKGDIPIVLLQSNLLKDQVSGMLGRRVARDATPGGMVRFPRWTPDFIYTQLTNEVRTEKGWENSAKRRNEGLDLLYYAVGLAYRPHDPLAPWPTIALERFDWDSPPPWADELDLNSLVIWPDNVAKPVVAAPAPTGASRFAALGSQLGG